MTSPMTPPLSPRHRIARRAGAAGLSAAAVFLGSLGTALAQGAPMQLGPPPGAAPAARAPQAAPQAATPTPTPPTRPSTDSPTAPAIAQPETTASVNPASLAAPVRRPPPRQATGVDASARDIAQRINAYFNGIRFLQGDFVQIGPDGRRTTGRVTLDKPGKVRFRYNAPSPIEIIADGRSVAVRDRRLNTQDIYPLSQTPLRFLLSERVDILRDANVTSVTRDADYIIVMLEERQAIGGTNRLMVLFDANTLSLRQWTVYDAQGFETSVALHNLDASRRPPPSDFRINYERMLQ